MSGVERVFREITDRVVDRPKQVVVACLLVTVLFAPGMALLESEAGSDQFTEGIDEADALDRVNEQFEPAFGGDEPTTQLIQRGTATCSTGADCSRDVGDGRAARRP